MNKATIPVVGNDNIIPKVSNYVSPILFWILSKQAFTPIATLHYGCWVTNDTHIPKLTSQFSVLLLINQLVLLPENTFLSWLLVEYTLLFPLWLQFLRLLCWIILTSLTANDWWPRPVSSDPCYSSSNWSLRDSLRLTTLTTVSMYTFGSQIFISDQGLLPWTLISYIQLPS